MAELKAVGCHICQNAFLDDGIREDLEALKSCGHVFHSSCIRKFEQEGDIILRVCFKCKADYGKAGTLKLKPAYQTVQLERLEAVEKEEKKKPVQKKVVVGQAVTAKRRSATTKKK